MLLLNRSEAAKNCSSSGYFFLFDKVNILLNISAVGPPMDA